MNQWTLVYRPPVQGEGHLVFIDPLGRVSLADWSGESPDTTDDGPLIVQPNGTVVIHFEEKYGIVYLVRVHQSRRGMEQSTVWTGRETVLALRKYVLLKFLRSKDFERIEREFDIARALLTLS